MLVDINNNLLDVLTVLILLFTAVDRVFRIAPPVFTVGCTLSVFGMSL